MRNNELVLLANDKAVPVNQLIMRNLGYQSPVAPLISILLKNKSFLSSFAY